MYRLLLSLALTFALAACGDVGESVSQQIAAKADEVARDLRAEMAGKNLGVGDAHGLPKAEITPEGELLIDGKALGLDEAQRMLALAYREQVTEVAATGAEIGLQGASLATEAMSGAVAAALAGDGEAFGKKMEGEGEKIRIAAAKLCARVPALLAAQAALAEAVPEFKPYAERAIVKVEGCEDGTPDAPEDGTAA